MKIFVCDKHWYRMDVLSRYPDALIITRLRFGDGERSKSFYVQQGSLLSRMPRTWVFVSAT